MDAVIDHVVLWVDDPLQALRFYQDVLGFPGVRVEEFTAGHAPFPSVRLSPHTIVDLMPKAGAPFVDALTGAEGSSGRALNHLCLTLSKPDFLALRERLTHHGVTLPPSMQDSFGAQGLAPEAFYFSDPDGNVLEARHYER